MPNGLSALGGPGGPPPAPNPQPSQTPQGNAGLMGAPMPGPMSPAAGAGAPQGPPPAPSHGQTVAALRHFSALEKELTTLLKDPDLGKADIKSKVIDGATKLVSTGIMAPAEAVMELGTFPERPFDQRKWIEQHFIQTIQAASNVLDHHRVAFAGQPPSTEPISADDHQQHMAALGSMYRGRQ